MDGGYTRRISPALFLNVPLQYLSFPLSVAAGIFSLMVVITPSEGPQFPALNVLMLVMSGLAIFGFLMVLFVKNEKISFVIYRFSILCTFLMLACLFLVVILK